MSGDPPAAYPQAGRGEDRAYVLVGPTAIGKSAVAECLAREDGLAILSADSMAVYRGMDIGTAKPCAGARSTMMCAGIDLADPSEEFSVGAFLAHAGAALRSAAEAGCASLLVGGTGLYIKGLVQGLEDTRRPSASVREAVRELHTSSGVEGLRSALEREAPHHLQALQDPSNPRRLMRALEYARMGLPPPSDWSRDPADATGIVGLEMERGALRTRIYERVRRMFEEGLLEEAAGLRAQGLDLSATARQAIGYAEAFAHLDGTLTREEAIYRTVVRTCQLAKKQGTFFRNQLAVHWIRVEPHDGVEAIAERVRGAWRRLGPTRLRMPSARAASDPALPGTTRYRTMKQLPVEEQPREAFQSKGPEGMTEAGLLALLLRTGAKGVNAGDLGRQLMEHHLNLTQLAQASTEDLAQFKGIGRTKAQILKAALELGRRLAQETLDRRPEVRTPEQAAKVLLPLAQSAVQEHFWVLILDTRYRLCRAPVEVSKGILDASLVHPREVFREAIRASARAVILAHNHPSGEVSPSSEDLRITRQLIDAGRILDIDVLDHVIVGRAAGEGERAFLSLRESGLVPFDL